MQIMDVGKICMTLSCIAFNGCLKKEDSQRIKVAVTDKQKTRKSWYQLRQKKLLESFNQLQCLV